MNVSPVASAATATQTYAASRPVVPPKSDSDGDKDGSVAPPPAPSTGATGKTVNLTA